MEAGTVGRSVKRNRREVPAVVPFHARPYLRRFVLTGVGPNDGLVRRGVENPLDHPMVSLTPAYVASPVRSDNEVVKTRALSSGRSRAMPLNSKEIFAPSSVKMTPRKAGQLTLSGLFAGTFDRLEHPAQSISLDRALDPRTVRPLRSRCTPARRNASPSRTSDRVSSHPPPSRLLLTAVAVSL